MDTIRVMDQDWNFVLSLLPPDWEQLAYDTGAFIRPANIQSPEVLLRLMFMHLGLGLSLRETAASAEVAELANVSDVTLLQRLRKCGNFFHSLCSLLISERKIEPSNDVFDGLNVRIVDATNVQEPGKTGSSWRLHTVIKLPTLECDYFRLTSNKGTGAGESFTQIPVALGDCLMGDRIYATSSGIEHIDSAGGYSVVRINSNLHLEQTDGSKFDLLAQLRQLEKAGATGEWPVFVRHESRLIAGRLCVVRKSADEIAKTEKKLRRNASKKCQKLKQETLELGKYVAIFSTIPKNKLTLDRVLELYRYRWQIELLFKRFKSLAQFGHLPKYTDSSSRSWLHGKLLICLLTEKAICLAESFSPWGALIPDCTVAQQVA